MTMKTTGKSMPKDFKTVFMGTPDFAVPPLKMLVESGYAPIACVTQPDKKAGRGHKVLPPPVKTVAESYNIPVYQFNKISGEEGVKVLEELAPNLLITAAFGHILSQEILDIPEYGCINVHASLLPKYRGAAPIQWAIINGETRTGITTMYTVKELDAGDILEQDEVPIPEDMTAGGLYSVLSELGAVTLKRTLDKLKAGTLVRTPQNSEEATYFPMFKKGFGEMDFRLSRKELIDFVRGTNPVPGAYMVYNGEKIKVYAATASDADAPDNARCGEIISAGAKKGLVVMAVDGPLSIDTIKREGAKAMSSAESLRGRRMDKGYIFEKDGGH